MNISHGKVRPDPSSDTTTYEWGWCCPKAHKTARSGIIATPQTMWSRKDTVMLLHCPCCHGQHLVAVNTMRAIALN